MIPRFREDETFLSKPDCKAKRTKGSAIIQSHNQTQEIKKANPSVRFSFAESRLRACTNNVNSILPLRAALA